MSSFSISPASGLRGEFSPAGDKSIAHRCLILSALSKTKTIIDNFPANRDCLSTIDAFRGLGIKIEYERLSSAPSSLRVVVFGKGLYGLREPKKTISIGDSGTTFRIILGVLAAQSFKARLSAAKLLSRRPMRRVTEPLRMMGAQITAHRKPFSANRDEEYPPVSIQGGTLTPIIYELPVASAQVKSAILLAGLYANGRTTVIEPVKTRDHTERLLRLFKAGLEVKENKIVITGRQELISPGMIYLPGDISSAAFFLVMAAILPDSHILIKNVSLNPTRTALISVLKRMGADIKVSKYQSVKVSKYEPMGDISLKSSALKGVTVKKEEIPGLIDELPILMVAASVARGKTVFTGVSELRVKETDRINSMLRNLKKMGAKITLAKAGGRENIVIHGVKELRGAKVSSFGDHRTAMSMVAAGLKAKGKTSIDDISCINKSFPDFLAVLKRLIV